MSLDIKKIYVDSRYKTSDSISDSEFTIDLPRSFNIPDDTVAYIDDIVLPIAWHAVTEKNNKIYFRIFYGLTNPEEKQAEILAKNYNGATFASALEVAINNQLNKDDVFVEVTYDYIDNDLTFTLIDKRAVKNGMSLTIWTDNSLINYKVQGDIREPHSLNKIINNVRDIYIETQYDPTIPSLPNFHTTKLDLHTTRNLYLVSSALASYDTISNFGLDTIIKKIPVRGNPNDLIFDNASEGFDYLNVSRRTLRHLDFKLVDTENRVINMNGMNWSFSIVFTKTRV